MRGKRISVNPNRGCCFHNLFAAVGRANNENARHDEGLDD